MILRSRQLGESSGSGVGVETPQVPHHQSGRGTTAMADDGLTPDQRATKIKREDREVAVTGAVARFDHLVGTAVRDAMGRRADLLPEGESGEEATARFIAVLTQNGPSIAEASAIHLVKLIDEHMVIKPPAAS